MFEKTSSNRRVFLAQCSKLALAGGLAPAAVLAKPSGVWDVSLSNVGFKDFAAQVGTSFQVRRPQGSPLNLVLLDASPSATNSATGSSGGDAGNERFSLVFMGPTAAPLGQDTYTFEHARIGRFAMFIVPLHSNSGEYSWYEAVFNRRPVLPNRTRF